MRPSQQKMLAEVASRQLEALRLFRPFPEQVPFFQCTARETLVRGGNRAGKSLISALRFAAIATDRPITLPDGTPQSIRLPHQKNRPLIMWTIGYQQNHIGQTIYRLLFRPGAFRIIQDEDTGMWRAYQPWSPEDAARRRLSKAAPPLIPPRYIKRGSWSWLNKGDRVFTKVVIANPHDPEEILAEIYAFTSTGEVKAGDPVDEIWIDEAIQYGAHYAEWQARLLDNEGRILWSSWPRMSNNALTNLTARAQEQASWEKPLVKEFLFTMSGNPHLSEQAKEEALAGWSADERRARDSGEYLIDNLLIYPHFNKRLHCAYLEGDQEDELSRVLRESGGEPPRDWTREIILDPGTTSPAVLFGAVPPKKFGDFVVVYNEINAPRSDASQIARLVHDRIKGYYLERMIIDSHAALQKPMGFGKTVGQIYSEEFSKFNIVCRQSGTVFTPGSDDFPSRSAQVAQWMQVRSDGSTKLRIVVHRCPNLVRQLETNVKALDRDLVSERPAKGQADDLRVSLEYWASRQPTYVSPPEQHLDRSPAYKYLLEMRARRAAREEQNPSVVHCGPGRAA